MPVLDSQPTALTEQAHPRRRSAVLNRLARQLHSMHLFGRRGPQDCRRFLPVSRFGTQRFLWPLPFRHSVSAPPRPPVACANPPPFFGQAFLLAGRRAIRTDIICMYHPPRVQRGHVRRPGHSAGRAVRDGYTCLGIGRDCSDWNYDGGLGIRRGCDRRMRSSSLATAPIVSSIGRQKRSAASIFPVRTGKSKGPFRASQEGTGTDDPPTARSEASA